MTTQAFRTALVTGASSGIGEQIARVLAERGCALTLVARRVDRLDALAAELRSKVAVEVVGADLAVEADVEKVAALLLERPVELLVNNAGVGTGGSFHRLPLDAELAEVRLNVLAVQALTHAALQGMVAARKGAVMNIGSLAGDQPLPRSATYAATKSFVTTFSESIAAELRGTGVTVTLVKPGFTYTEINADAAPDPSSVMARMWMQSEAVARASVDAAERGQLVCVPGVQWKLLSGFVQALPRPLVRALSSRMPGL